VKEALETIDSASSPNWRLRCAGPAPIAILASIIVLGGALAAGRRVRAQEAVILKTLGATRRRLILAMMVEYALLGLAASLFGLIAGSGAAYFIVTRIMKLTFSFPALGHALDGINCVGCRHYFGLAGTWRILGQKPAAILEECLNKDA
jgi:putative ABC transport system permease protein